MKNEIYVKNLEVYAYHGVFEEERTLGQKFIFNIKCSLDFSNAMLSDNLYDSVSYGDIAELVFATATEKKYQLLEKLSFEIIKGIFNKYSSINNIEIEISKPNAPINKNFESCGTFVSISREEFLEINK